MLSLPMLCLIIWLWVFAGCTPKTPIEVPMPVKEKTSFPAPPDVYMNGPVTFETSVMCPVGTEMLVGHPSFYTVIYAYENGDELVVFMITTLDTTGQEITQAWVDVDGNGSYDQYFLGEDKLMDAYPRPCDAIGQPI
jgi:hypothetical protein